MTPQGRDHSYPHFTDEETEAQRGRIPTRVLVRLKASPRDPLRSRTIKFPHSFMRILSHLTPRQSRACVFPQPVCKARRGRGCVCPAHSPSVATMGNGTPQTPEGITAQMREQTREAPKPVTLASPYHHPRISRHLRERCQSGAPTPCAEFFPQTPQVPSPAPQPPTRCPVLTPDSPSCLCAPVHAVPFPQECFPFPSPGKRRSSFIKTWLPYRPHTVP